MCRREGEVSAAEAARMLEVDRKTTQAWARRALANDPAPVSQVRRNAAGRYYLSEAEVRRLVDATADPSDKF